MTPANARHGFEIDLSRHVYPLLQLARLAIAMENALREVDETRKILPGLDSSLKACGLLTDLGQPVAPDADMVILAAIDLLEAHQEGPNYVAAQVVEGDA